MEDGMTLEDALADVYEEALAAGIDPDELGASMDDEDDDEGGEGDDYGDDALLDALRDTSSSEYETDEDA